MKNETIATIIAFPRRAGPSAVRTSGDAVSAQILFFTGVRIERHTGESSDTQTVSRQKRGTTSPVRPPRQRRRS